MAELAPLEIQALAKIMDELDYYQILHLERDANASSVKRAYYASSRTFHPDANGHLLRELREDCARISKRVTEAYSVLRDARRRMSYDQRLEAGEGLRIPLAKARAEHAKRETAERQGRTPQGRQFYQKAVDDLQRGDAAAAARNLQMALTFEPGNGLFQQKLADARARR